MGNELLQRRFDKLVTSEQVRDALYEKHQFQRFRDVLQMNREGFAEALCEGVLPQQAAEAGLKAPEYSAQEEAERFIDREIAYEWESALSFSEDQKVAVADFHLQKLPSNAWFCYVTRNIDSSRRKRFIADTIVEDLSYMPVVFLADGTVQEHMNGQATPAEKVAILESIMRRVRRSIGCSKWRF